MLKQIILIIRLIISQVRSVTEIPGVVWCIVGAMVSVVSFFTAFVRKVEKPFMFYLTFIIGVGMVIYGIIKIRKMRKDTDKELQKRMSQRSSVNTNNQNQNQQTYSKHTQSSGLFGQSTQQSHNVNYHQNKPVSQPSHTRSYHRKIHQSHSSGSHQQQTTPTKKFCPHCGSAVHPHHKFCANCGNRLF
jgi:hypothetical protein